MPGDLFWWLAGLAALLGVAEVFTTNLVFGSLAVAFAGAAVSDVLGAPLAATVAVGVVVAAAGLFAVRPAALRRMQSKPELRTGAAALVGRSGVVIESGSRGVVNVDGQHWSAVALDGADLEPGDDVWVVEVDGATLHVAKSGRG